MFGCWGESLIEQGGLREMHKESIQGVEHKSQRLQQVSRTILFVLNCFSPWAALPGFTPEWGGGSLGCVVWLCCCWSPGKGAGHGCGHRHLVALSQPLLSRLQPALTGAWALQWPLQPGSGCPHLVSLHFCSVNICPVHIYCWHRDISRKFS